MWQFNLKKNLNKKFSKKNKFWMMMINKMLLLLNQAIKRV